MTRISGGVLPLARWFRRTSSPWCHPTRTNVTPVRELQREVHEGFTLVRLVSARQTRHLEHRQRNKESNLSVQAPGNTSPINSTPLPPTIHFISSSQQFNQLSTDSFKKTYAYRSNSFSKNHDLQTSHILIVTSPRTRII